jgi:hypothetical protein
MVVASLLWRVMCFGVVSPDPWKKKKKMKGVWSCEEKYAHCEVVNLQWKNTPKDLHFQ